MQHVKQAVRSLLLAALLCAALAATAFAAGDGSVWIALSDTSGKTAAQIVADTTVTDGVVELTYDSSVLTYEGVEVTEAYVAMYSINAEEAGVVRISWVAPGEYSLAAAAALIQVNFTGTAGKEDISLSGSASGADGEAVPIDGAAQAVDTSKLEEAIAKAEALKGSDYTDESWAALEQALVDAKAVLANPLSTQEEVDAATLRLTGAIEALAAKNGDSAPGVNPPPGSAPSTGDSARPILAIGLMVLAVVASAGCLVYKRRAVK